MRYLSFMILLVLGAACEDKADPMYDGCARGKLILIWCENESYGVVQILSDPNFAETWTYNNKEYPHAVMVKESDDLVKKQVGLNTILSSGDSTFDFNYNLRWGASGERIWPACGPPFLSPPDEKILITTILSKPCP